MTGIEARLEHALQADAPARDPMFRVEILVRRERAAIRRRLLTIGATALGAAILAPLGLGALGELAGAGTERLAVIAAAGIVLTAFLATSYLGALPILWSIVGRCRATALSTLRAMPSPRRWY